jgi:hypothetical protein
MVKAPGPSPVFLVPPMGRSLVAESLFSSLPVVMLNGRPVLARKRVLALILQGS